MREDIESVRTLCYNIIHISKIYMLIKYYNSQIEARNNKLEMQSFNYKALAAELDSLLETLHVPTEVDYFHSVFNLCSHTFGHNMIVSITDFRLFK